MYCTLLHKSPHEFCRLLIFSRSSSVVWSWCLTRSHSLVSLSSWRLARYHSLPFWWQIWPCYFWLNRVLQYRSRRKFSISGVVRMSNLRNNSRPPELHMFSEYLERSPDSVHMISEHVLFTCVLCSSPSLPLLLQLCYLFSSVSSPPRLWRFSPNYTIIHVSVFIIDSWKFTSHTEEIHYPLPSLSIRSAR